MTALRVDGVVAGIDGTEILHDVSFDVGAGETVAVTGANGSGKSVLGRVIVGLVTPASGSVSLDGVDVTRWPADRRARAGMAYVPQVGGLVDTLTVDQHLRLAVRGGRRSAVGASVLERLPAVAALGGRRVGVLSGGERRLVVTAMALVAGPAVLVADEPSAGLADDALDLLVAALGAVGPETATVLIEQDLDLVGRVADRVVQLDQGRVST